MTPVPGAELIPAFLRTRVITEDEPAGRDLLTGPADLDRWWREHGGGPSRSTADDLDLARTVREGLRAALARHNDATVAGDEQAHDRLEQVTARFPVRATVDDDVLVAASDATSPALTAVLITTVRARLDGTWPRLKVCRDPLCREAYLDTSRNRSRTWCSMEVCGARAKQRSFVERRRARNG